MLANNLSVISILLFVLFVSVFADREATLAGRYQALPFYDSFRIVNGLFSPAASAVTGQKDIKSRIQAAKDVLSSQAATGHGKARSTAGQVEVCPFSEDGYHVISTANYISPEVGAVECARFGWQYAIVPEDNWGSAAWTIGNCTSLSVGIRSFNGFVTSGCQLMQGAGGFLISQDSTECNTLLIFPLLCKEGPVETIQETLTEDFTTLTTTTTMVTLTTPMEKHSGREGLQKGTLRIDKQKLAAGRKRVQGKLQGDYDICPYSHNGLYMVYDAFSHVNSFQVCADLGLTLADIDESNSADLLTLFDECQPYDVIFNVNSYAGIASGLCRLAYVLPWYNIWGLIGVNPNMCLFLDAPVICQESPSTATETVGTAIESTVFTTQTETQFVAVATDVITVTQVV